MPRKPEPQIVGEIGFELGGEKPHLGKQMSSPLAPEGEVPRDIGIEDDDRLRSDRAVLRRAEGHDVDTGLPCGFCGRAAETHKRIRETGAVHMDMEGPPARDLDKCADLVLRINSTKLGRLCQRQCGRLNMMHDARGIGIQYRGEGCRIDFRPRTTAVRSFAPPENISGAPHSSRWTCASSWQTTAP